MNPLTRALVLVTGLAMLACGCDGNRLSTTPSTPTPTPMPLVVGTPTATSLSPNVGSTSGDTLVVIFGTGFLPVVTVTFDTVPVAAHFDSRYTDRIYVSAPPHGAGTVDVLVTNAGGQPGRLAASYTYAAPASFDFNGTWWGYPIDGSDLPLSFTIQNNELLSASCETSAVTFSPPLRVTDGSFSFSRDGSTMTGKIVSTSQAVGAITLAPCNAPRWEATNKPSG